MDPVHDAWKVEAALEACWRLGGGQQVTAEESADTQGKGPEHKIQRPMDQSL